MVSVERAMQYVSGVPHEVDGLLMVILAFVFFYCFSLCLSVSLSVCLCVSLCVLQSVCLFADLFFSPLFRVFIRRLSSLQSKATFFLDKSFLQVLRVVVFSLKCEVC